MPRQRTTPQYLLEEPTTGLFIRLTNAGAHLATSGEASRFQRANDAYLAAAAAGLDQAHELVRVDA